MALTVALGDIEDALADTDEQISFYLDRQSGELLRDDADGDDHVAETVDADFERYLALPTQIEIDDYSLMQRFTWSQTGEKEAALTDAIAGSGAFRKFRQAIARLGLKQQWAVFQANAYRKLAASWCLTNGIKYTE